MANASETTPSRLLLSNCFEMPTITSKTSIIATASSINRWQNPLASVSIPPTIYPPTIPIPRRQTTQTMHRKKTRHLKNKPKASRQVRFRPKVCHSASSTTIKVVSRALSRIFRAARALSLAWRLPWGFPTWRVIEVQIRFQSIRCSSTKVSARSTKTCFEPSPHRSPNSSAIAQKSSASFPTSKSSNALSQRKSSSLNSEHRDIAYSRAPA